MESFISQLLHILFISSMTFSSLLTEKNRLKNILKDKINVMFLDNCMLKKMKMYSLNINFLILLQRVLKIVLVYL